MRSFLLWGICHHCPVEVGTYAFTANRVLVVVVTRRLKLGSRGFDCKVALCISFLRDKLDQEILEIPLPSGSNSDGGGFRLPSYRNYFGHGERQRLGHNWSPIGISVFRFLQKSITLDDLEFWCVFTQT